MRTRSSKGWGQLPRSLAKALAETDLSKNEGKLLWAIVYKTIAFNKLEDKIPQKQLVNLTGIEKRNMNRTVNSLLKKGVIFRKGNIYGVELDFYKWEKSSLLMTNEKVIATEGKVIATDDKKSSLLTDSRELSKRAFQERGLSTLEKKKKKEANERGLKMLKEGISKASGGKLRWR